MSREEYAQSLCSERISPIFDQCPRFANLRMDTTWRVTSQSNRLPTTKDTNTTCRGKSTKTTGELRSEVTTSLLTLVVKSYLNTCTSKHDRLSSLKHFPQSCHLHFLQNQAATQQSFVSRAFPLLLALYTRCLFFLLDQYLSYIVVPIIVFDIPYQS